MYFRTVVWRFVWFECFPACMSTLAVTACMCINFLSEQPELFPEDFYHVIMPTLKILQAGHLLTGPMINRNKNIKYLVVYLYAVNIWTSGFQIYESVMFWNKLSLRLVNLVSCMASLFACHLDLCCGLHLPCLKPNLCFPFVSCPCFIWCSYSLISNFLVDIVL